MKIYKFWHSANDYKSINLENTKLLDKIVDGFYNDGKKFNCDLGIYNWIDGKLLDCDFPMINGSIPVASEKALEVISPFVDSENVEILPIVVNGSPFYVIHLLKTYNVLNEKKSSIQYFKNGDVKNIKKYVFLPTVSEVPSLFQIEQNQMFCFVKDDLRSAICNAGLVGADFEECEIKGKFLFDYLRP